MAMNLGVRSESLERDDDRSWLGSAHATDTGVSVTLDGAAFLAAFPDRRVPSGVVASRNGQGLYEPGDSGADAGHLLEPVRLVDTDADEPANPTAALLWHGRVIVANLPSGSGFESATTPGKVPGVTYH